MVCHSLTHPHDSLHASLAWLVQLSMKLDRTTALNDTQHATAPVVAGPLFSAAKNDDEADCHEGDVESAKRTGDKPNGNILPFLESHAAFACFKFSFLV
jgi:hypothetical protein